MEISKQKNTKLNYELIFILTDRIHNGATKFEKAKGIKFNGHASLSKTITSSYTQCILFVLSFTFLVTIEMLKQTSFKTNYKVFE